MAPKNVFYTRKFILLFIPLFFIFVPPVYAANVTLQWNPNSEPNLDGYRVFFREEGQSYDYTNPLLKVTEPSCDINNIDENKVFCFVVRAFDTEGFESGDSNEVCLEAATTPNNHPPIAVIDEDYIEAIAGTTITLDGSRSTDADDGIASYHWSQIDGNPVSLSDPTSSITTFTAPETDQYGSNLTFQLTLTDFGGLQGTAISSVYVRQNELPNNPPAVAFSYTTRGKIIAFSDRSIESDETIVSWFWDFGDGKTSTEQNPKHRYGKRGNYSVSLTVTDDGGVSNSTSKTVTVTK